MPSFNLITEPWIPAVSVQGVESLYSVRQLLADADSIRQITGNPLEAAVIHRFLFAAAHRVSTPTSNREWLQLWIHSASLFPALAEYFETNLHLFDLYDPHQPFLQHPGLAGGIRTPAELIYDRARGNNPVFLDACLVAEPITISSAEAARALLVTHACSGSGTGGLNPLNGNKKDTMYAGPLCARMVCLLEGANLRETILLNIVPGVRVGRPGWERPRVDAPQSTASEGVCDIYTRATRNISLTASPDGKCCTAVSIVMGEAVTPEPDILDDPMIPVYFADKKAKALRVQPDKALWRNSHVLLAPVITDRARPLPAMNMISNLVLDGWLEAPSAIRLRTLGAAANAQGPVTEMWIDETLPFSLNLFADASNYIDFASSIESAEVESKNLERRLRRFASRYLANGGGDPDPKDVGRLVGEISPNLTTFWGPVGQRGEGLPTRPVAREEWTAFLESCSRLALREAIDSLPADARRMRAEYGAALKDPQVAGRK